MSAKRRDEAPAEEIGPGQSYLPFVVMEDLLDKLKLINYDTEFTVEFKVKPANRHYFAIQTNPGEQFFMFSSLATWLIRKCGIQLDTPQESDDPNTTILNILDVLRSMGTAVDFPPSKLKQGWGEQVIFVLDHLADMALKKKQFMWKMLIPPEEGQEEETTVDDNVEVTLEKIEEEMMEEEAEGDDDDDEGPVMDLDALKNQTANRFASSNFNKPEEVMQSSVDSAEWRLEVERVLPQLKVVIHPDSKAGEHVKKALPSPSPQPHHLNEKKENMTLEGIPSETHPRPLKYGNMYPKVGMCSSTHHDIMTAGLMTTSRNSQHGILSIPLRGCMLFKLDYDNSSTVVVIEKHPLMS